MKSLKLKLRKEDESKYNSPWNIAVDMSFSPKEISTMLNEYSKEKNIDMDIKAISEELYELTKSILIDGEQIVFNRLNSIISIGVTYGIFKKGEDGLEISNKIFEDIIYSYMISKIRATANNMSLYNIKSKFIERNGELNIEKILKGFQQFMHIEKRTECNQELNKSNYYNYLEKHGVLLFLSFIKPIINGTGFDFKEIQILEEKRLDLVITYNNFKYIIEMKIWRGSKYYEEGINQLCDYLNINGLENGYLLVFNFNKNKQYKEEKLEINNKKIIAVYV